MSKKATVFSKNHLIHFIVFVVGFVVMLFEITAARAIAPFFGTSIYVWTSVIGVILSSLSLGYWVGGLWSDKNATTQNFAHVLLASVFALIFVILCKNWVLFHLSTFSCDIRLLAIVAAIILFGPPVFLFGMVSPFASKIVIKHLPDVGKTVGRLYAISTIGSIAGTFLAGFVLLPILGVNMSLTLGVFLLILCFLLLKIKQKWSVFIVFVLAGLVWFFVKGQDKSAIFQTPYAEIKVFDRKVNQDSIRYMKVNNYISAAAYLNKEDLVYEYLKYYRMDRLIDSTLQNVMMIGGSACTYPQELQKDTSVSIDVVEIDRGIIDVAKKYFGLKETENLNLIYEDARPYLNTSKKKYDVIYVDAFASTYEVPFQLTTVEAIQKMYDCTNNQGGVIVNLISSFTGSKSEFFQAEYATYKAVFPNVTVFQVEKAKRKEEVQNICIVATKSPLQMAAFHPFFDNQIQVPKTNPLILTDDHAPVEVMLGKFL